MREYKDSQTIQKLEDKILALEKTSASELGNQTPEQLVKMYYQGTEQQKE